MQRRSMIWLLFTALTAMTVLLCTLLPLQHVWMRWCVVGSVSVDSRLGDAFLSSVLSGSDSATIADALGPPDMKESTGHTIVRWGYDDLGVRVSFSSDRKVLSISRMKGARGGVGTTGNSSLTHGTQDSGVTSGLLTTSPPNAK